MTQPLTQAPPNDETTNERLRHARRHEALESERSSWLPHWQDLNDYILPRRLRYLQTERNKGYKANGKIINNTGTRSARTLGAGKMAGMTSPARIWQRYVSPVKDDDAIAWCADTERRMGEAYARTNTYSKLHETWQMQGVFGTHAFIVEEDDQEDFRLHSFPLGQYCLACDSRGKVDTFYRKFSMTVIQMVQEFGLENCSDQVVLLFKQGQYDQPREIRHVIEPNINRQTGKIDNHNMAWLSTYWEVATDETWDRPLRKSGYEEFPIIVARWDVVGEDVYGSGCPGMDALGDIKGLQKLEVDKASASARIVTPPMKAPAGARSSNLSIIPNTVSFVDEANANSKFEPSVIVPPQAVSVAKDAIIEHERRIISTFFADLFQMFLMDDAQQPRTATDINKRYEEKMLMLGPVVERDQDEVLDPLNNRAVAIMYRRGKLLPVPPALRKQRVKIEYTSVMAQAQKLLGTTAVERFTSYVGSISAVNRDVLDIPNFDRIVRRYAEMLGLDPDSLNTEKIVAQARQMRQQQMQAQAAQAAMAQGAESAKVASQADLSGDNVLSRLLSTVGGQGAPVGRA